MSVIMPTTSRDIVDVNYSRYFLKLLLERNKGLIEVREIVDGVAVRNLFLDGIEQLEQFAPSSNANVFVGMFTRKKRYGKKESCLSTMFLWMDYDGQSQEEVKKNITTAGLPEPSIWVHSGHGIHTYWLLEKPARKGVIQVLKAIAKRTDGDISVTDIARVMRLPGTMNVKGEPVRCQIIKVNGTRYTLKSIAETVGVDVDAVDDPCKPIDHKLDIPELSNSHMSCFRIISKGVQKGQRNFALGKIVALLKLRGFNQVTAFELVKRWNKNNTPSKPPSELKIEFEGFWNGDYKYLGCSFSDPRLQKINEQLCSMGDCEYHAQQEVQIIDQETQTLIDNEIYKDTVFPKIKGLELAVYSILSQEKEIERDHLLELLKRNKNDKSFPESLKKLKTLGYIDLRKSGNRNSQMILLKKKDNYGRGYTLFNSLLWRVYVAKIINDTEYKLLALLKWYAYSKKVVYPSVSTLAKRMGVTERTISKSLRHLHEQKFIERKIEKTYNGSDKLYIHLKY